MKLIMENWRSYLNEEELEEGKFQDAMSWVKEKGKGAVETIKQFFGSLKEELEETSTGAALLQKLAAGQQLSEEESQFLKEQVKDLASGTFLLGLFILPGGGIASAALVKLAKKFNIDLMPSSFQKDAEAEPVPVAERDWQKESERITGHENNKERIIGDGGQANTEPYEKDFIKKRSKSAPPSG